MKSGVSSLNPYAVSYVPLSKREAYDRTESVAKDPNSGNELVWYENPVNHTRNQHQNKISLDSVAHDTEKLPYYEVSGVKSIRPVQGSYGSSTSKQMMDEEFDMDLEYLQMSFPGLCNQSLTDVYLANKGDLDATVDMLTQLEFDPFESSENLPDTLDIGDVSDSSSSSKLKNVVGEASASSSGSADPATGSSLD